VALVGLLRLGAFAVDDAEILRVDVLDKHA
jgi:hypothetical protein